MTIDKDNCMVSFFPFRQQHRLIESGYFTGLTDWHSHILPGVDDGIQQKEESLKVLHEYEQIGIKKVWLTPHIMEDIPNTTEKLHKQFDQLCTAYTGSIELHLAAENMMDNTLHTRLADVDLLPIGLTGGSLLVETSYYTPPMKFYESLELIADKGYQPLLAHPERYVYMTDNDYGRLKDMGVAFQLNLLSLGGHYGKQVEKKAKRLLHLGCYDVAGSDLHSEDNIHWLKDLKLSREQILALKQIKENEL